jgi:hypothetical protein
VVEKEKNIPYRAANPPGKEIVPLNKVELRMDWGDKYPIRIKEYFLKNCACYDAALSICPQF